MFGKATTSFTVRNQMAKHSLPGSYTLPPMRKGDACQRLAARSILQGIAHARQFFGQHPQLTAHLQKALTWAGENIQLGGRAVILEAKHESRPKPWKRVLHTLKSTTGEEFVFSELIPLKKQNGKCVVLMGGLGISTEAYFRVGESDPQANPPILYRLIERGFRVIILDAAGLGRNEHYRSGQGKTSATSDELLPVFMEYLKKHPRLYKGGLYFLAHSMGGFILNRFLDKNRGEIARHPALERLFKNRMTLGAPEVPIPDAHIFLPLLMMLDSVMSFFVDFVPYQKLGAAAGKTIPYGFFIGGDLSLISFRKDFPVLLFRELFDYAIKNFSTALGTEMLDYYWGGLIPPNPSQPLLMLPGQRNVRLVGHSDGLAPVEGLYARLLEAENQYQVCLVRIKKDSSGLGEALNRMKNTPVVGIAVDDMKHLDCACPNEEFERNIWPVVLSFLMEAA